MDHENVNTHNGYRNVVVGLALLALASCGTVDALNVTTAPVDIPPAVRLHPPLPEPLALATPDWRVVPAGTATSEPLYCLPAEGYGRVKHNEAELIRWIRDAMDRLLFYRSQP